MKKQSNAAKIRVLLAEGVSVQDIAKKLKLNTNYVHQVKWHWGRTPKGAEKPKKGNLIQTLNEMTKELFPEKDMVNHPDHYTDGGIETIDFIEAKGLDYHLANVVKYVSRAGKKGDMLEDLKKAQWYLNRRIERASKSV